MTDDKNVAATNVPAMSDEAQPDELDSDLQDEQAAWDKQMGRKTPEQVEEMMDGLAALAEKYKVKPAEQQCHSRMAGKCELFPGPGVKIGRAKANVGNRCRPEVAGSEP